MDINQNELKVDFVKKHLEQDMTREMNQFSGRNRTYKALEFKIQNVSAVDPREMKYHPMNKKSNFQQLLDTLYRFYMDKNGKLTPKVKDDLELMKHKQRPKFLPFSRFKKELTEISIL